MHIRILIFLAALILVACSDDTTARTADASVDAQPDTTVDAGPCADAGTQWATCIGEDAAHQQFYETVDAARERNRDNDSPGPGDETVNCDSDPTHVCLAEQGDESCGWDVFQRGGRGGKPYMACDCDYELSDHHREQYCDGD